MNFAPGDVVIRRFSLTGDREKTTRSTLLRVLEDPGTKEVICALYEYPSISGAYWRADLQRCVNDFVRWVPVE